MKKRYIILLITLFAMANVFALEVPKLQGRVNDKAGILSSREERALEEMLQQTERETSAQIALLTIKSLEGEDLEDYSIRVAEEWGLGQKDRDNGLLLLIAVNDRKLRFEVGYGLEGIITDLKAGYIIRNVISPEFRKGDFYEGIKQALGIVSAEIKGKTIISDEELAKYRKSRDNSSRKSMPIGSIIFLIFIFSGVFRGRHGGLFTALLLGNMLGGGNHRSGGFGGGGFGGFSGGGGSFGGGGASGGW
jgi:uncharacterized protein